jgi:hypothetical protein
VDEQHSRLVYFVNSGGVTVFLLGTMLKAMFMWVATKKKFVQKQHRC